MKKSAVPCNLPIQQFDEAGRHRIILQNSDGTMETSAWAFVTDTIQLGKLFAAGSNSPLPAGLFTVKSVPHKVLL